MHWFCYVSNKSNNHRKLEIRETTYRICNNSCFHLLGCWTLWLLGRQRHVVFICLCWVLIREEVPQGAMLGLLLLPYTTLRHIVGRLHTELAVCHWNKGSKVRVLLLFWLTYTVNNLFTHCDLAMLYGVINLVTIGPGNDLVPPGSKPLLNQC